MLPEQTYRGTSKSSIQYRINKSRERPVLCVVAMNKEQHSRRPKSIRQSPESIHNPLVIDTSERETNRSLGSRPPHFPRPIAKGALKGPLSKGHFTASVPESITTVYKEGDEERINHPARISA
ncbi:hypothetical protein NPIL_573041 [Nephila pilipes]|uniref:Uncharacterized protein n=1 Tax=Nephila pilipes TaxID=299642 RepID=A0A8X6NDN7_NEPPI|nr:hypothetical protein NPIL_573041 [Nephila pilipes]